MDPSETKETLQNPPPPLHQMEADEEDENVKQLEECSKLYLSLQDCLVKTNRNWKSCQLVGVIYEKAAAVK
ncbi:cox19-like CHCH family protein isoform X2 [Tasmannia lanceolata]|uniref:cox19-like CHCH family protein isoform X2 n=1 Tax=Tasmannia lanceolata TaxID=3420 RepID=UPI0040628F3F